ncbi:MAG: hypothetical protein EBR83_06920 [Verrucomicrobia bacterium]|nr:hypothetical protein [Verrucomicrobiota bacterium]
MPPHRSKREGAKRPFLSLLIGVRSAGRGQEGTLQLNADGFVLLRYPMKTLSVLLAALLTATISARPPNVVVIFIDDMGYGDIGPYGATKQRTPHLDRMAKEGMKLTSFYAAPVCSVSRAQMMTGCYGARVSVPGVYFPGQSVGLNPSEVTVAERLKEKDYTTQMVGKRCHRKVAPGRPARIPAYPPGLRPLSGHPLFERHAQEVGRHENPGRAPPAG